MRAVGRGGGKLGMQSDASLRIDPRRPGRFESTFFHMTRPYVFPEAPTGGTLTRERAHFTGARVEKLNAYQLCRLVSNRSKTRDRRIAKYNSQNNYHVLL